MEKWSLVLLALMVLMLFLRRPSNGAPVPGGYEQPPRVTDADRFRQAVESVYPPVAPELVAAIWYLAPQEGQDPYLLAAIAWQESHFRLNAQGKAGERGPYQLTTIALQDVVNRANEDGAVQYLPDRLEDPEFATLVASRYLRLLQTVYMKAYGTPEAIAQAGSKEALVLTWYNAGPGRVVPAALQYAQQVLQRREELKRRAGA